MTLMEDQVFLGLLKRVAALELKVDQLEEDLVPWDEILDEIEEEEEEVVVPVVTLKEKEFKKGF
jgi:hypothetical protein